MRVSRQAWVDAARGLPRRAKQVALAAADFLIASGSLVLAVFNRLGGDLVRGIDEPIGLSVLVMSIAAGLIAVPTFWYFGLYREITRYIGPRFALRMAQTIAVICLGLFAVLALLPDHGAGFPRTSIITACAFMLLGMTLLRLWIRWYFRGPGPELVRRVAIFGAGDAGAGLAAALAQDRSVRVVAFFDDKPALVGQRVGGIAIHPAAALEAVVAREGIAKLLLALPPSGRSRRRQIHEQATALGLTVLTAPTLDEIRDGRVRIEEVRPVQIEDLLGRDPVAPRLELLRKDVTDWSVLVTGAGGSIGAELCRQLLRLGPSTLVLVDSTELNLFQIEMEIRRTAATLAPGSAVPSVVSYLASVTDGVRMDQVIGRHRPHTIYHAAAYKHVPIVEVNEPEGAETNVIGTLRVAEAAARHGVRRMVLVSTDKAVRPTSVMGASKRLAEMVLQALQEQVRRSAPHASLVFTSVRFGNVLGSSGSVVPVFREQIAAGGPVTVTHPDVTRYFMTIPEAVQLILQAGSMATGGEVFVLEMGDPVRIDDLARRMIRLAGFRVRDEGDPTGDISIAYTGLRPGEKMFEELVIGTDVVRTDHPGVLRAQESRLEWAELEPMLSRLEAAVSQRDAAAVREVLKDSVREYARTA